MKLKRGLISVFIVLTMLVSVLYSGTQVKEQEKQNIFDNTKTVHIWYADEALTDHLSSMAVKFNEEYGVRVIPVLQSGLEFLEKINEASLTTKTVPDLYIASNDIMEKAYLTGLATEISNPDSVVSLENFPESAIYAVTYQQKLLGYPLYYETSALLYNMTYLESMAQEQIEEEMGVEVGSMETMDKTNPSEHDETISDNSTVSEHDETISDNSTVSEHDESADNDGITYIPQEEMNALIHEKLPSLIPRTFDALLDFAEHYDAPENVEAVFKWDVADIFYNYFFVGNYIDVGGMSGDSTHSIDIYNLDAIKALKVYQDLSQYFAIEADDVAYDSVIQDFMEGKIVMTTATTDVVRKLEEAKESGEFVYDYGIATIPNLNAEMETKGLSVTSTIYVNGYSKLREEANKFASYLVDEHAPDLYTGAGKVPANKNVVYDNPNLDMFMDEYQDSVPMPKMMATSNFWVKMEIIFDRIWNGSEVSRELKGLSEQIMTQVKGMPYEETYIEMPQETEEYFEYSDDE